MSGIFNPAIFNNVIFNTGEVVVDIKTGTGGIDPEKRRRIYKPTGLVDRKKERIEQRVQESRDIQKEVFDEVIGPQLDQSVSFKPIQEMTSTEVDKEIAFLMKEKMIAQEESEMMDIIKMLASD